MSSKMESPILMLMFALGVFFEVKATYLNNSDNSILSMNETMHYAFEHLDAFTQLPSHERMAQIDSNKYALSFGK